MLFVVWPGLHMLSTLSSFPKVALLLTTVVFFSVTGGQTATYKILDEESTAIIQSVTFLSPFALATDKMQKDDSTLREVWKIIQGLYKHAQDCEVSDCYKDAEHCVASDIFCDVS